MRVYLGSDHAGFELKEHLVAWLTANGHDPVDCGPAVYDAVDDYPPYVLRAAERTVADQGSLGIVIGGPGHGEALPPSKGKGRRARRAWEQAPARPGPE